MIKSTKKSLRALMMCALLLVGGFIVVKAMSNTEKVKNVEETTVITTTWYFTGSQLAEVLIASAENWTTVDPELGCGAGDDLPCSMPVENTDDLSSLQQFLDGKTEAQIRDIYADSKRAE